MRIVTSGVYIEIEAGEAAVQRLAAALHKSPVACVLLRTSTGQNLDMAAALEIVRLGQSNGAAVLVGGDARLAHKLGADGVHLDWSPSVVDDYLLAREMLGVDAIIGAEAGHSRHDAMVLAETGAAYIGFRPAEVRPDDDQTAVREARLELLGWWAEVAEVPCIAFDVASLPEAEALIGAGADFVAATLGGELTPADAATWVSALSGLAPTTRSNDRSAPVAAGPLGSR